MPDTYTIAAAARLCGVARRTLQRAIAAGRLGLTPDHRLTLEALAQAGYAPATEPRRPTAATPQGHRSDPPQALAPLLVSLVERLDHLLTLLERREQARMPQERTAATDRSDSPGTHRSGTSQGHRSDAAASPGYPQCGRGLPTHAGAPGRGPHPGADRRAAHR